MHERYDGSLRSDEARTASRRLTLEGVRKEYDDFVAVEDVSFALEPGEFLTLLGPSGSGKTSTLMMVAGFEQPTGGAIKVDGGRSAAGRLTEEGAEWITFTSASTVENFHARFDLPSLLKKFPQLKPVSIGPETTRALSVLGLKPFAEARPHTIDGVIAAIEKADRRAG